MTDPQVAIALHYAWGAGSPTVTASGQGKLAARIVDEAVAHGVPVHADAQLAALLTKTPVGTAIPPAAFLAVAQLLSFLYDVDRLLGEGDASER